MNKTRERRIHPLNDRKQAALIADMSRLVRRALADTLARLGGADHVALTVERAEVPIAPARMAAVHPGSALARAQARELYERCLEHYRKVVRARDARLEVDDVGAALACFVAANLRALRGVCATPDMLLRLERQIGGVVRLSPAWASASARDRQFYFEQMAILAVLISETSGQALRQGPAAVANVQRAARGYLQQLLGLDPDALTLGPEGLSLLASRSDAEHAAAGFSA